MKVDFIISGTQKCGTTALFSFLSQHKKVVGSKGKELDFFNYQTNYSKGIKYYHSRFNKPLLYGLRKFKFFEASPSYLSDGDVLQTANRIYDYNSEIKIISIVRNPVDRAFSAWNMYKNRYYAGRKTWWFDWVEHRTGKKSEAITRTIEEYDDFLLFIQCELESIKLKRAIECPVLILGNYYLGINFFKKVFKDNYLVIKNEELNNNTSNQLNIIIDFLNLPYYNWEKIKDVKVFKGDYSNRINEETLHLLQSYYSNANEELYNLTGINYND